MDKKAFNNFIQMNKDARIKFLRLCDDAYYNQDNPIIDDETYDQCISYFNQTYKTDYASLGDTKKELTKYKHEYPVLSLAKIHSKIEYMDAIKKFENNVIIEPKIDGLTVVYYPDGTLVSRGDGYEGEVLPFANKIPGLPKPMNKPVRMEVFIDKAVYNTYFKDKDKTSNSRNVAAGILRRKEYTNDIQFLNYRAYNILGADDKSEIQQLTMLRLNDFKIVEFALVNRLNKAEELYEHIKEFADEQTYPTDGIVIKYDAAGGVEKYGITEHHPNNMIAYKFETLVKRTILRDVIWSPGRDTLTPVAVFDEIELNDNKISKASVHNLNIVNKLKLAIGFPIAVTLKNEIIPQIISCESNHVNVNIPEVCPYCGADLEINESHQLVCPNINCSVKTIYGLMRLASKEGLNIKGCNKASINKIYDKYKSLFNTPFDIFRLTRSCLEQAGFTLYSASQLYNNITKARTNVSLANFLCACNVPGLGSVMAKKIANFYHQDFNKFINEFIKTGKKIDNIGDTLYYAIVNNLEAIKDNAAYVSFKDVLSVTDYGINYHIAITGKLSKPRNYYKQLFESKMYNFDDSVTKKTDYLVTDNPNDTSSKLEKARKYGIKIITEEELMKLIGE